MSILHTHAYIATQVSSQCICGNVQGCIAVLRGFLCEEGGREVELSKETAVG